MACDWWPTRPLCSSFRLCVWAVGVCCSAVLVELEWSPLSERCVEWWVQQGIGEAFIRAHPGGVAWDCASTCGTAPLAGGANLTSVLGAAGRAQIVATEHCATCLGFPYGHPECIGVRWAQRFPSMPTAVWFILVTVTPAVSLSPDVYPVTVGGQVQSDWSMEPQMRPRQ